jgi:hypothetical protein
VVAHLIDTARDAATTAVLIVVIQINTLTAALCLVVQASASTTDAFLVKPANIVTGTAVSSTHVGIGADRTALDEGAVTNFTNTVDAVFAGTASVVAGTAAGGVGFEVFARTSTVRIASKARTLTINAGCERRACVVALTTMLVVCQPVDASAGAVAPNLVTWTIAAVKYAGITFAATNSQGYRNRQDESKS